MILNERWDWWNQYTDRDELLDCLIKLDRELERWPKHEEVTEVWPRYTLMEIQRKFGAYDLAIEAARDRVYSLAHGYLTRERVREVVLTPEQRWVIAEIKARTKPETKAETVRQRVPTAVRQQPEKQRRSGRAQMYSDVQLMSILRQMVEANGGRVPATS